MAKAEAKPAKKAKPASAEKKATSTKATKAARPTRSARTKARPETKSTKAGTTKAMTAAKSAKATKARKATKATTAKSTKAPKAKTTAKPATAKPAKAKPPVELPPFTGFDKSAPGFFHELAAEMNRDWFEANKARYESLWLTPMKALLHEVTEQLRATYKPLELGEPKILRIYRDVRFSNDKSPYKTNISGVVTLAGKKLNDGGNAAMYLHVGVDEEFVGVGCYMFDSARLQKWRKVIDGKQGPVLAKIVADLRAKGYVVGGHDDYKRVPKPFDEDHPHADLLKMKGLTGGFPEIPAGMLHKPELRDWLVEHGKAMRPVVAWLQEHIG